MSNKHKAKPMASVQVPSGPKGKRCFEHQSEHPSRAWKLQSHFHIYAHSEWLMDWMTRSRMRVHGGMCRCVDDRLDEWMAG